MRKYGKKYQEAQKLVEVGKTYTILEAAELIKKVATTKFDATVTVQFNLGLDVKQADQQLRGAFVLPNGTGKTRKVLAITNKIEEAKAAGADFVFPPTFWVGESGVTSPGCSSSNFLSSLLSISYS